jgi:hypothetical protein
MKCLLLIAVSLVFCAGMASAQSGYIGLFVDFGSYADCDYVDAGAALIPVYVVHKMTPGAVASQFKLVSGGGFTMIYTGEIVAMPTVIGSTYAGISLAYGGCRSSDILLVTINYFAMGSSPSCAYLEVVPDPSAPSGTIEVIDCGYVKLIGGGSRLYVNPDGSCSCQVVPVEETTWGHIKTLYQ